MKEKLTFICPICRDSKTKTSIDVNKDNFIKPLSKNLIHTIINEVYEFLITNKLLFDRTTRKVKKENRRQIKKRYGNRQFKESEIMYSILLVCKNYECDVNYIEQIDMEEFHNKIIKRKDSYEEYDVPNWCYSDE